MAKAPAATVPAPLFKIESGVALPPIERKVGAATSPFTNLMKSMVVGKSDKDMQSFFIPADVPAAITDPAEREKAGRDEARKISNRVSGLARRLNKQDATLAFALRTRTEGDKIGVRVYRIAATAPVATVS